jgi:hypothetical protein
MSCDIIIDTFVEDFVENEFQDCETKDQDQEFQQEKFSSFIEEIKPIVRKAMSNYFDDKKLHNGNPIDPNIFESSYYTNLLISTNIIDGVKNAYKIIEDNQFLQSEEFSGPIEQDVIYIINLIRQIHKRVPQDFVGGMILMHLELIEGLEVW